MMGQYEEEMETLRSFPEHVPCVRLNWSEVNIAQHVGCLRYTNGMKIRARHKMPDGANDQQAAINGALTEFAVSKHLGRFWHLDIDQYQRKGPDVGETIQVRYGRPSSRKISLIVRQSDLQCDYDPCFILTTMLPHVNMRHSPDHRTVYILGFMRGSRLKANFEIRKDMGEPHAWFIEAHHLEKVK